MTVKTHHNTTPFQAYALG